MDYISSQAFADDPDHFIWSLKDLAGLPDAVPAAFTKGFLAIFWYSFLRSSWSSTKSHSPASTEDRISCSSLLLLCFDSAIV